MLTSVLLLFSKGSERKDMLIRNFYISYISSLLFLMMSILPLGPSLIFIQLLSVQFIIIAMINYGRLAFLKSMQ